MTRWMNAYRSFRRYKEENVSVTSCLENTLVKSKDYCREEFRETVLKVLMKNSWQKCQKKKLVGIPI